MTTALEILAFADRKEQGRFPVLGVDGAPAAFVTVPWGSRRFTATTAFGQPLCGGRPRGWSRDYDVVDAAGRPRFTVHSGFWSGKRRTVTFADGTGYSLQGASWPDRSWLLLDSAGATSLRIATTSGTWSLHPDAYEVRIEDPRLTLGDVVGIVQANRIIVKSARAAAA